MPCVWLWSVTIHLSGGLPMDSAKDLDTGKAELKATEADQAIGLGLTRTRMGFLAKFGRDVEDRKR